MYGNINMFSKSCMQLSTYTFCTTPKTSSVKEAATKRDKPDVKDDKSNTF